MVIHVVYQPCKLNFDYFILQLNTNKSHVVGFYIGPSSASTARNRSSILVDCCVNDFLPALSSMGSCTANIVVLRMVCEVPFRWEKRSHVAHIHPPLPNNITNPNYRRHWTVCWLLFCPVYSKGGHQYQNSWKITPFLMHRNNKNRAWYLK